MKINVTLNVSIVMGRPQAAGMNCIKLNEFIRRVDGYFASFSNTATVLCNEAATRVKSLRDDAVLVAKTANRPALTVMLETVTEKILKMVTCDGSLSNVRDIRRRLDGIRCDPSPDGKSVKVRIVDESDDEDRKYVPPGYVKPRVFRTGWAAHSARAAGWKHVQDHGWLMPVARIALNEVPMPAVVLPGPQAARVKTPQDEAVEAYAPPPETTAPGTPTPTAVMAVMAPVAKKQGGGAWKYVALATAIAIIAGGAWWWWMRRRRAAASATVISQPTIASPEDSFTDLDDGSFDDGVASTDVTPMTDTGNDGGNNSGSGNDNGSGNNNGSGNDNVASDNITDMPSDDPNLSSSDLADAFAQTAPPSAGVSEKDDLALSIF